MAFWNDFVKATIGDAGAEKSRRTRDIISAADWNAIHSQHQFQGNHSETYLDALNNYLFKANGGKLFSIEDDLDEHKADHNNPHQVTAAQSYISRALSGAQADNVQSSVIALKSQIDTKLSETDAQSIYTTKTVSNQHIKNVTFNSSSGRFTFTKENGQTIVLDTDIEKIAVNFRYDTATQKLVITNSAGQEQSIDLSSLISEYEFKSSDSVQFSVGTDHKVTAVIHPDYLEDIIASTQQAHTYAISAQTWASQALDARYAAEDSEERCEEIYDGVLVMKSGIEQSVTQALGYATAASNSANEAAASASNAATYWSKMLSTSADAESGDATSVTVQQLSDRINFHFVVKDGKDGQDGKDGEDGAPGAQGPQGPAGQDGKDGEDGAPGAQGPAGQDGAPGAQGPAGQNGRDGADGQDGQDGRGIESMSMDQTTGVITVTYTDGTTQTLSSQLYENCLAMKNAAVQAATEASTAATTATTAKEAVLSAIDDALNEAY